MSTHLRPLKFASEAPGCRALYPVRRWHAGSPCAKAGVVRLMKLTRTLRIALLVDGNCMIYRQRFASGKWESQELLLLSSVDGGESVVQR